MKNKIILILITLTTLLSSQNVYADKGKKKAIITAFDTIGILGSEVTLIAKLERDWFFPYRVDLRKQTLGFYLEGREIGRAVTGKDGMAWLSLSTKTWQKMSKVVQVRLISSKYRAPEVEASLTLWPRDQIVVVTDIDKTISANKPLDVVRRPIEEQPAFNGASEVLHDLAAEGIGIIYLTAREDALMKRTREWLAFHGFPNGHLVMWDIDLRQRRTPRNHGEYKTDRMGKFKRLFPNIIAGFGDRPHDLDAYHTHGVRAFFLRSEFNEEDVIPGWADEYRDWLDIPALLNL